jgi:hypothetical protein
MHAGALSQAATRERLIKARVQIVASSSEPIRSAGIDRSRLFADVSGENLQHDALDRQAGVSISADEFLEELQNEPSDPPGPAFDRLVQYASQFTEAVQPFCAEFNIEGGNRLMSKRL